MFCTKCGQEIRNDARFCPFCGAAAGEKIRPAAGGNAGIGSTKGGNKNLKIMLGAFLGVLVLAGIGGAVWHFTANRSKEAEKTVTKQEQTQETKKEETQTPAVDEMAAADETAEEVQKVTSDTNEVVNNRILDNVPKAVNAYDFEDDADGAQAVVRNNVEQQPEAADVTVQYVDGIEGKAVYLDGTYGISLQDIGRIGESYTVAFWIKADDLYDWSPFIHIGYDVLDTGKRCRLWVGQKTDGASVAPILSSEQARDESFYEIRPDGMDGTMQPGAWYHIVFTVDGTRSGSSNNSVFGTLYVSGEKVGEGDVARDVMNVDAPEVFLGINCWDALFPAAYDGVRIWNLALDEGQVKELYQAYGAGGETAEAVDSAEQGEASLASYAAYQDILNEIHGGIVILYDEGFDSDNMPDVNFGSLDCIYNQYGFGTAEEALDSVGYTLQDFDGNGVDELVVGLPSGDILELYTLQNGAAAPLLLNGTYREAYWLAEDDIIYNQGSSGAAAGSIAAYHVTGNGVELIEGYEYTDTYNEDSAELTHSTGGILTTNGSVEGAQTEMKTVDWDTVWEIQDSFFTLPEKGLELTPLSSLQ